MCVGVVTASFIHEKVHKSFGNEAKSPKTLTYSCEFPTFPLYFLYSARVRIAISMDAVGYLQQKILNSTRQ